MNQLLKKQNYHYLRIIYPRTIILFFTIKDSMIMQFMQMPLFEIFLPVLKQNSIRNWTSNDFWKQMKLAKHERNKFNRQRMYRILRRLVEFGFLEKNVNHENSRFSKFNETAKLHKFKYINEEKIDISNIKAKEIKIHSEIIFLEKQNEQYQQLGQDFPTMKNKIFDAQEKCCSQLIELKAYQSALKSIIAS